VANDAPTLVDKLALLLSASQLTNSTRSVIASAVGSIAATTDATRLSRIHATILLIMTAPDYLVQK
jgi:hypothetical protein